MLVVMKDYYVWETEQKGGHEFAGNYYPGRFYPKNDLINSFGSDRPDVVNITASMHTKECINYGIALFSKQSTGKVRVFHDSPLIYFNNLIDSSFLLFEMFPNYVWEHLGSDLYRFVGYGEIKNSGIIRINEDYTFTLLGDII